MGGEGHSTVGSRNLEVDIRRRREATGLRKTFAGKTKEIGYVKPHIPLCLQM